MQKAQKFDLDKPRIDLVDPYFLEVLGSVLGFGAKKYASHNWREGLLLSRLIGAAYRHLGSISRGEDVDSESGLQHVGHLACCVMFLCWTMKFKPECDDRWKYEYKILV